MEHKGRRQEVGKEGKEGRQVCRRGGGKRTSTPLPSSGKDVAVAIWSNYTFMRVNFQFPVGGEGMEIWQGTVFVAELRAGLVIT